MQRYHNVPDRSIPHHLFCRRVGPLYLETLLQDAVLHYYSSSSASYSTSIGNASASSSLSSTLNEWIQLTAFAFSSEIPSVANTTSSNNALVAEEWKEELCAKRSIQQRPLLPVRAAVCLPANPIDLLNPDFVELLRQYGIGGGLSPCIPRDDQRRSGTS